MDSIGIVALARTLVDIDSTTGREAEAGRVLAAWLGGRGWTVTEQPVEGDRVNVLATREPPVVVLSTHYDCVPPFMPSAVTDGRIYGRGSCDAKGILAAQAAAAERLVDAGERRVGLLFVVGEERGSDGARAAAASPIGSRYLLNGEPTDNRLGIATRGTARFVLSAAGRAAHSAYPDRGESAIEKLVDAIAALRTITWPSDPVLGETTYSVGMISGGVAPNVIPPAASAEVMFRTVGEVRDIEQAIAPLGRWVGVTAGVHLPPVHLHTVPGVETAVFAFGTDVPFLSSWGRPLLMGPGSIHVAHTDHEHVAVAELDEAVELYVRVVRQLLADDARSGARDQGLGTRR
jgi:acetylornithine deacetylase